MLQHVGLSLAATAIAMLLAACGGQTPSTAEPADAVAQQAIGPQSANGGEEVRDMRLFQMALWDDYERIDSDLAFFSEGAAQPNGYSILRVLKWWDPNSETNSTFGGKLAGYQYDWSRIVAVLVDEPYMYNTGARDRSNPCRNPADPRNEIVTRTARQLADAAAVVASLAPSTRFWVNFTPAEIEWARDSECPIHINQPYIDVVSLASYWGTFAKVARSHYDWLSSNPASPHQQLAIIPGTFFRDGKDDPYTRASYLQGYFAYANTMNRRCDLPLGRVGATGNWDGCPVWLVLGWLASTWEHDGYVWRGVFDPRASVIATEWRAQFALQRLEPILGRVESYDSATRTFTGWAVNRNDIEASLQIQLWSGGSHWSSTTSGIHRTDVGGRYGNYNAGFTLTIPEEHVDAQCHAFEVYALVSSGPPNVRQKLDAAESGSVCLPGSS